MKSMFLKFTGRTFILFFTFTLSVVNAQVITQTFVFTGFAQTYTVPGCVGTLSVDLRGAQGGQAMDNTPSNGPGGLGGRSTGVLTVTPGQVLTLMVGGRGYTTGVGGFNGGGAGGTSTAGSGCYGGPAGGGGGASDIRTGFATLFDRVIVAGGGGGAGRDYCNGSCQPCGCGGNGGCGGGLSGSPGFASFCNETATTYTGYMINGGAPGTATAGGTGGPGDNWTSSMGAYAGTPGSFGQGGNGGNGTYDVAGGGGGGGYYGGGGGGGAGSGSGVGAGGGGGGSAYLGGVQNGITSSCFNTSNGLIILSYVPGISPLTLSVSSGSVCSGSSSTISGIGQVSYTWSTGSNSSSVVVNPTITSTYYVVGTNSAGCSTSASITVGVDNILPTLSVVSSPTLLCPGQNVLISASGASSYNISGGVLNGVPFSPTVSGTYTIVGSNACGSASAAVSISVHPYPTLSITASTNTLCLGTQVSFTASGVPTYTWFGGIVNGVPISPAVTSNYSVQGTSAQGCTVNALTNVTVYPFAGSSITAVPATTAICAGSSLFLSASSVNSYSWSNGSNASAITVTPTSNTNYTVLGTNNFVCISGQVVSVIVNSGIPSLSITASSLSVCPNQSVNISASGAITYTFSSGIVNGQSFVPSASSIFSISGSNGCGVSSGTIGITVNQSPTVVAVATSPTICSGTAVSINAGGGATLVFSNGVVNNQVFFPATSSGYTITGYSAQGCTATAITSIQVIATPNQSVSAVPALICIGMSSTLTSGGAASYSWQPGAGTNSLFIVSPLTTTTYTLTKTNANCTNVSTVLITVNQLPTVLPFSSPTVVCASSPCTLSAAGALTYSWTSPLGFVSSSATTIVSPAVNTTYTLSVSDGTCSNTGTLQLNTNPNPTLNVSASNTNVCIGNSSTLTAQGGSIYAWTPAGGTGSVAIVSPTVNTMYNITCTNNFGCSASAQLSLVVKSLPNVSASANKILICSGDASTLTAVGAVSYTWNTGINGSPFVVTPTVTTNYFVQGTSIDGCVNIGSVQVQVYIPIVSLSPTAATCFGQNLVLTASGASSYSWSTGQNTGSISVTPTVYTVYQVSTTSGPGGLNCFDVNTVSVSINPNPTVTAAPSQTLVCRGSTLALTAGGANTYSWSNGTQTQTLNLVAGSQTSYTVIGTDINGCTKSASTTFKISTCVGIDELSDNQKLYAIFPNPSNGNFTITSSIDFEFNLYDESGRLIRVLQLNNQNKHLIEMKDLAAGTYYLNNNDQQIPIHEKIVVIK